MKNNKVLIATGIYPPDIGGPATMLKALADSLIKNNWQVKVITYSDKNDYGDGLYRIKRDKNIIFRYLKYFLQMAKLARWADIIYVTDTYSVGYFAFLLKKIFNKKYIVRFAGDSAWEKSVANGWTADYIVDFQTKVYNSKIEKIKIKQKKILTGADGVIAVSGFMSKIAGLIGVVPERIKVIYNAIGFIQESSNQEKISEIKEKFGTDSKIIMTVCRLTPWKGVDGIIKILPGLKKKIGRLKFLILGDGPQLDYLKSLAVELAVNEDIIFLGRVEHRDIVNYLKAADLFVLNTNYEGLSHALLEAMKAEVPIITTNVGGNPEVITNGSDGLLVNYNDVDELLKSAEIILTDQNFSKSLIGNASQKLKDFSWEKTVSETVKLLNKVCNE